jgi:hypothetical protein
MLVSPVGSVSLAHEHIFAAPAGFSRTILENSTMDADDPTQVPDRHELVPLGLLDPCPWNPKSELDDDARQGLEQSLDTFGFVDDLKVWPSPWVEGRYIVLNGNQRLDVIRRREIRRLADAHVDEQCETEEEKSTLRDMLIGSGAFEGPDEPWRQVPVECRIIARLDLVQAKALVATFDRHRAAFDEAKQDELARQIADSGRMPQGLIDVLLNPRASRNAKRAAAGLPPAREGQAKPRKEPKPGLPGRKLSVLLTEEGFVEIRDHILRAKDRLQHEGRLAVAVRDLAEQGEAALEDWVVELALLIAGRKKRGG